MSDKSRYYLCCTCGQLKHEELFRDGAATCDHCRDKGNHNVNWKPDPDGEGWVEADASYRGGQLTENDGEGDA